MPVVGFLFSQEWCKLKLFGSFISDYTKSSMPDSRNMNLLANKIKKGDIKAFDLLYHTYSQKLYGFAFSMLKNHEDAKEIVQETFVKIWEKREMINPSGSIQAFLFSVSYHTTIDIIRKRFKDDQYRIYLQSQLPEQDNNSEGDPAYYQELIRILDETIRELPEQRKKIYLLSREEGLSHREIAEKLNISVKTVENQINLALKKIRKQLISSDLLSLLLFVCLL
jgi:RNA polymerase sigma-70 factor (ECF subfamily)